MVLREGAMPSCPPRPQVHRVPHGEAPQELPAKREPQLRSTVPNFTTVFMAMDHMSDASRCNLGNGSAKDLCRLLRRRGAAPTWEYSRRR